MAKSDRKVGRFRAWTKRLTLRQRILAVNIFAIGILFGCIFYLDSFRTRLTDARIEQAQSEAVMIAHMMAAVPPAAREPILIRLGRDSGTRLRLYAVRRECPEYDETTFRVMLHREGHLFTWVGSFCNEDACTLLSFRCRRGGKLSVTRVGPLLAGVMDELREAVTLSGIQLEGGLPEVRDA